MISSALPKRPMCSRVMPFCCESVVLIKSAPDCLMPHEPSSMWRSVRFTCSANARGREKGRPHLLGSIRAQSPLGLGSSRLQHEEQLAQPVVSNVGVVQVQLL